MERDGSLQGLEAFDQLSIDKARNADVADLDDEGWRIASIENRIEELGSLGEGAGGAVTKAKLKGKETVFALKVTPISAYALDRGLILPGNYNKPGPRREEADHPRVGLQ
jgi:mitogen-activated protein kinase kinase